MRGRAEDALAPTFSLLHPPYSFFFPNGKDIHHLGVCVFCLRPWPRLLKFEGQKQTLLCPRLVFPRGHTCHRGQGTWEKGKASADDATCDLRLARRPPVPAVSATLGCCSQHLCFIFFTSFLLQLFMLPAFPPREMASEAI